MDNTEQQQDNDELVIPQTEVIKIVRLLGQIAGMNTPLQERKRVLMENLATMVDADGWLWSASQVIKDQQRPVSVGVIHGGLTQDQFNGMLEASQLPKNQPPEDPAFSALLLKGNHITRTRQQVVSDDIWYNHPTIKQYKLDRNLDHFLYSIYPLSQTHCSCIGFFRHVGRKPFTDLQRRICHIIVSNIEWLHKASFPDHQGKDVPLLSPRLRTVLIYLLEGCQKDEIATQLCISPNTAKTHIRNIYRHFNVNSQIELIRHFQIGNQADTDQIPGLSA